LLRKATDAGGGRDDDGGEADGGGRGRGWRRVKPVVGACPLCWTRAAPEIIILLPKNSVSSFYKRQQFLYMVIHKHWEITVIHHT